MQKNEASRQTKGGGLRSEKEADCPGFFPLLVSLHSSCLFWLFSPLLRATKITPWFIWRENWIKNGKEADMWTWQLVLTPTHWESKEVYCFNWHLVFGDILFVAVIFKAIQLLYFEGWVWEKPFSSFGTTSCLKLPVTATVLCQSSSEGCFWMKSQDTCPASPGTESHFHASSPVLLSFHTVCLLLKTAVGKHMLSFEGDRAVNVCNTYNSYDYDGDFCPLPLISYCFDLHVLKTRISLFLCVSMSDSLKAHLW